MFLREFALKYPNSQMVSLDQNDILYLKDPVKALEYLYIMSGTIEITLEL